MIRRGIRRAFHLALRTPRRAEREVDEEIRSHLELRAEQLRRRGVPPEEADAEARRRFGPMSHERTVLVSLANARDHDKRWSESMDAIRHDLAYAVRQLRRAPGHTAASILTLALGIGANATMFGVIDHLLLRVPAHITAPDRLTTAALTYTGRDRTRTQRVLSYPIFLDIGGVTAAFSDIAAYSETSLALGTGATASELRGLRVSGEYFRTLGVKPFAGRFFAAEETDAAPGASVVVLGYGAWQNRFGGARALIGRTIDLGGTPFTVVGIAPEGFTGVAPGEIDAWIPITAGASAATVASWREVRQSYWLTVVARLRPGVTIASASAASTTAIRGAELRAGSTTEELRRRAPSISLVSALPREANREEASTKVALLLGGVSLLVLILACANVANLQLARAIRRQREVVIRLALGVSRGRLLGQLLVDSMLLAVAGGLAAIVVAAWGGSLARRLLFSGVDWVDAPVDGHLLVYTGAIAMVTGVVTGLIPALQSMRTELTGALKTGAREGGSSSGRVRFALLAVQAALTVVLLVGTGLFVFSLHRIDKVPLGMEPDRVLVATVNTGGRDVSSRELGTMYTQLKDVARSVPGVEDASVGMSMPFRNSSATGMSVPGRDSLPVTRTGGPYFNAVGPFYFRVLGTRVIAGREFNEADRRDTPAVAVINQTTAALWWPGESAVGKCVRLGDATAPCAEIVGVVENARRQTILEDETVQVYVPTGQGPEWSVPRALFIRAGGDASQLVATMQRQLQVAIPSLPFVEVSPLDDAVNPQKRSWRLGAAMFGAFGLLAVVLAAVGLYGVLSYDVAQRGPELGVRMALGATGRDVGRLVISRGFRIAIVGGGIGALIALAASPIVGPLLYGTSPRDPIVFGAVAVILGVIVFGATALPALRAARIEPSAALRETV